MPQPDQPPRPELTDYVTRTFPGASITPLAGDASTRRFHRIALPDGSTHIVMDYGGPLKRPTDDVYFNRIFCVAELRVAEILKISPGTGCLVLEDLGDTLLEQALERADTQNRLSLLRRAVALAADIDRLGTPVLAESSRADGPALDAERFRFEMDYFLEHYVGALLGRDRVAETVRTALHELARVAANQAKRVLCHRDFHSRNLMLLDDGSLAMVDIQDARWGPDSYDLASLLRDAYVDIPEEWVEPLIRHYLDHLDAALPYDEFKQRFEIVAAQRMLKALGTFGYQIAVLGRRRYESAIPRTVTRLRKLLPLCSQTRTLHADLASAGLLDAPGS